MSDTSNPGSNAESGRRLHQVPVTFTVDTRSGEHAINTVRYLMRALAEGRERQADVEEPRARLAGWSLIDDSPFRAWEPFEGTDIPDMVAEMFPPEPRQADFRSMSGVTDEDEFEDAHEQWREECLTLAINASRLPDLLARFERAERVRDAVVDVMARYPLPKRPRMQDYSRGFFGKGLNEAVYTEALDRWQENLQEIVTARERALETVLAEGGTRTAYLPPQFHAEWVPRDLMAITALRALLDADPAISGRLLDRDTRAHLASMLHADDPDVRIADPDDPDEPELYEGPASEAHRWIPPGVYEASSPEGQGEFRVVVGRAPMSAEGTASWAFPPAEHDSHIVAKIAHTLEAYRESEDGISTEELLDRLNDLVDRTGRSSAGAGEPTRLEQGVMLSELLARRDRELGDPTAHPKPPTGPEDPGLAR